MTFGKRRDAEIREEILGREVSKTLVLRERAVNKRFVSLN